MFSKEPSRRKRSSKKKGRNQTFLDVQAKRADPPKPLSENISIAFVLVVSFAVAL